MKIAEQLTFFRHLSYCLYEVDMAIFTERNEKIAIEICGDFYGNEDGLLGKK